MKGGGYKYSLEHLTALSLPPAELVQMAARIGYDAVSLRFIGMRLPGEPDYDPSHQPKLKRDLKNALDETGLFINDIEVARICSEIDPAEYEPEIAVAAEFGVRSLLASVWTDDRPLALERFAQLCSLAARYKMPVALEFVTWASVRDVPSTVAFLRDAGNPPNAGILLDTLHAYRARTTPEQVAALPAGTVDFIHLCDSPAEIPEDPRDHIPVGRAGRLYPGEGVSPIRAYCAAAPYVDRIGIELPNVARVSELGLEGHARRCLETAKALLENPSSQGK